MVCKLLFKNIFPNYTASSKACVDQLHPSTISTWLHPSCITRLVCKSGELLATHCFPRILCVLEVQKTGHGFSSVLPEFHSAIIWVLLHRPLQSVDTGSQSPLVFPMILFLLLVPYVHSLISVGSTYKKL